MVLDEQGLGSKAAVIVSTYNLPPEITVRDRKPTKIQTCSPTDQAFFRHRPDELQCALDVF